MEKKSLVIVHNVAKRHNIGTLARSATAFGVSELILVGRKDFNSFGSHGSALHLSFRHFYTLEQARQYLKGTGLSSKEMEICDFFVYISQYGCGTASLNVTIAASIVLHHFAVWAGFPERRRDGQKFVVAEKPVRQVRRNFCAEPLEVIVKERTEKKELGSYDWLNEGVIERNEELKEKTEDSFSCMPENKNETTTLSMLFDSDL
uniref:tRNA/rRNA methyltransferase SpoU type domain-containing protein n=1 Tax=Araucaria cunninghamii TaxID=56994 RepID=A0A0D6R3N5_ARACU